MSKRSYAVEPVTAQVASCRLFAATDLGQVLVVEAADEAHLEAAQVVERWGEPHRAKQAVECLAVSSRSCPGTAGTSLVAVGRVGGHMDVMDAHTGAVRGRVCTAAADRESNAAPPSDSGDAAPDCDWTQQASWTVAANVLCMSVDGAESRLAVGSKGSELGVWDLHTQQRVFLGKGKKPNHIGLVDPAHNSAVAYLPGPDSSQVIVGTGKHRLRLYDVRAQRRPALDVDFGASRITSLAVEPDGLRAWAGDASGNVGVLDLRAARLAGALKGLTGSSRALACHSALPVLAIVSLDRFLRFYDTQSRKLLGKVFLKQPPTRVAFGLLRPNVAAEPEAQPNAGACVKKRRKQP
ncbi:hypothetical protein WJX81_002564 [Elliptochloris bilobata]|uniref:Uncharacterized protein n=1 Tax=Elliptochloris bilobata TaxID=381761 RepID=A0AAW1SHG1_9CHLO